MDRKTGLRSNSLDTIIKIGPLGGLLFLVVKEWKKSFPSLERQDPGSATRRPPRPRPLHSCYIVYGVATFFYDL